MISPYGEYVRYPAEFLLPMKCASNHCNRRVAKYQNQVESGIQAGQSPTEVVHTLGLPACCSNTILNPVNLDYAMVQNVGKHLTLGRLSSSGSGLWYQKSVVAPASCAGAPSHTKRYNSSNYEFGGYVLKKSRKCTTNISEADDDVNFDATKIRPSTRLSARHIQMLQDLPLSS